MNLSLRLSLLSVFCVLPFVFLEAATATIANQPDAKFPWNR